MRFLWSWLWEGRACSCASCTAIQAVAAAQAFGTRALRSVLATGCGVNVNSLKGIATFDVLRLSNVQQATSDPSEREPASGAPIAAIAKHWGVSTLYRLSRDNVVGRQ